MGSEMCIRDSVGIVGRTPHVIDEVSSNLSIPYGGTDWAQALIDCQPDIVSIGTPGGAHYAAIKAAISQGAHIFCDKPMAINGTETRELFDLAKGKGVKTAFAASFRYMPQIIHAKRLVASGVIGEPQEVECMQTVQIRACCHWQSPLVRLWRGRLRRARFRPSKC